MKSGYFCCVGLVFDVEATAETVSLIRAASTRTFVYLGRGKSQEPIFTKVTREHDDSATSSFACPLEGTADAASGASGVAGTAPGIQASNEVGVDITDSEFVQLVMSVVYDNCGTSYHFASLKDYGCEETQPSKGEAMPRCCALPVPFRSSLAVLFTSSDFNLNSLNARYFGSVTKPWAHTDVFFWCESAPGPR